EADLASLLLLDVGTGGVVAAGDEGAESPAPPHEVVLADRALLVDGGEDLDRELAALATHEPPRLLALGVARAGEERAEATLLEDHRLLVLGADRLSHVLVDLHRTRALARELAGVLALRVAGAGQEVAVAAPLLDHRLAALVADLVGRLLVGLDVLHLL